MPCSGTDDRYVLCCGILDELQDIIDSQLDCDILMSANLNTELSSSSNIASAVNDLLLATIFIGVMFQVLMCTHM